MVPVHDPATEPIRRPDPTLVALLALAAALRLVGWGSVGLDHFDEGAYAYSAAALAAGGLEGAWYPRVELLAPPFQYGAGALAMLLFGITDRALIGVSVLLGVGTVGLVWIAARRWMGRPAALAAALLLALSDFHILYSRSGLADVSFGFWLVAALLCFGEAELRASWRWAALAGLATGVAWNTKYHGWLALVIATGAIALRGLKAGGGGRLHGSLERLGVAAVVAAAAYAPWAIYVSSQPGGYALLLEHHASFVRPASALAQAWAHFEAQLGLDGWLGRSAPGLGALVLALGAPAGQRTSWLARAILVGAFGLALGQVAFIGLAALAAASGMARQKVGNAGIALSFLLVFSLLTPLYVPYPRLVLPWLLAATLLAGLGIATFVRGDQGSMVPARRARWILAIAGLAAAIVCASVRPPWRSTATFQPKDGFRSASAGIASRIEAGIPVLVWSEPAVAFYLRTRGVPAHPIVDIREAEAWAANGPPYLVTSLYSTRLPGELGLRGWSERHPGALREEGRAAVTAVSDVRLMDDFGLAGGAAREPSMSTDGYDLRLFRMTAPPPR